MDTRAIALEICDQADEFLAGVRKRDEARAGIAEYLTLHHPKLSAADKKAVTDQAMRVLENEDFFSADAGGSEEDVDSDGFSSAEQE
jgi:hypothetical protein